MSCVLGEVIHPDQTCAIPGRKITDSLILIRDAICYARDRNMRLVVLNLDFEKAFDRVSHQYLFKVLQKMGFPERFLAWVGLLYGDITTKILVNGHLSKSVGVHCGLHQGCPLSPLLFVACIEPLAQVLRKDQQISGEREPVCPVRRLATGEPTTVWRNVAYPALLNRHRDLSWMVAHKIIPVRAVMHTRGMARTPACPRPGCGQDESVRHLLWECRAARDLWKEAGPLMSLCLPAGEDLTPQLVLYGVGRRPIPPKAFTKLWPTFACLKDALWSSRNLLVAKRVVSICF
ncbi:uncharacterized protein LOC115153570 [Salmo trutta]|uniref:uncharacterized protein LOC115153570 n=1 Tax=Salmo trutta TaxID=8032 RepID=UPI001130DA3B|nr:uncharacterized protein LOC115153570 [Salmo trutta]